jgi:serine/threonine-protein kinase
VTDHALIAEILTDFQERRDRGDVVSESDLVAAHPDLADQLSSRLAELAALRLLPGEPPSPVRPGFRRGTEGFESQLNAYMHERLRVSAWFLAVTMLVILGMSFASHLAREGRGDPGLLDGTRVLLLVCFGIAGLFVLVLRSRHLASRVLVLLDAGLVWCVVAACTTYYVVEYAAGPTLLVPFLGFFLLARAVVVPSRARRTLALSITGPLAVLAVELGHGELFTRVGQSMTGDLFVTQAAWHQAFLGLCVGLATLASHLNFALRQATYEATQIGQYELKERIGQGGMGDVYRARHALMRRPTAVKVIRADAADPRVFQRFEHEVRQTSRLTHPNTIAIYDYGRTPDGTFYYAMELLEGADLQKIVNETGPLPASRVIHVLAQACDALHEAHAIGLVHRDVKERNLILCERGTDLDVLKVLDFGLVKDTREHDYSITGSGEVCGTPHTISPEAIRARKLGPTADIYGLGAVGCFLLTARQIFDVESPLELISRHLNAEPIAPSARRPDVPRDLEAVLLRCLRKPPDERPQSARELRRQLLACDDAGRWTQADARTWWAEKGPILRGV